MPAFIIPSVVPLITFWRYKTATNEGSHV